MTALKFLLEFWQFTCRTSHIYSCFQLLRSYNHNVSMFSYSLIYLMFSFLENETWIVDDFGCFHSPPCPLLVMNVMWKLYSLAVWKRCKVDDYYKKQERQLEGYTEMETMLEPGRAPGNPAEVGYSAPPRPQNFHIFLVIFYNI